MREGGRRQATKFLRMKRQGLQAAKKKSKNERDSRRFRNQKGAKLQPSLASLRSLFLLGLEIEGTCALSNALGSDFDLCTIKEKFRRSGSTKPIPSASSTSVSVVLAMSSHRPSPAAFFLVFERDDGAVEDNWSVSVVSLEGALLGQNFQSPYSLRSNPCFDAHERMCALKSASPVIASSAAPSDSVGYILHSMSISSLRDMQEVSTYETSILL